MELYLSYFIYAFFLAFIEQPIALVIAGEGSVPFSMEAMAFSRYFSLTALASSELSSMAPMYFTTKFLSNKNTCGVLVAPYCG